MHSKMILVSESSDEKSITLLQDKESKQTGWFYLGSHNATPAAWGEYIDNERTVLNIKNWELGIIFPLKSPTMLDESHQIFKIPFKIPPASYVLNKLYPN